MRILVSVASRHGATMEIGQRIGQTLAKRLDDVEVTVEKPENLTEVTGYDAYVLGSAVYMGRWLEPARYLARQHAVDFEGRPVWLFSSGPIGDPPKPDEQPVDVADAMTSTNARDHHIFTGKLDKHRLGFAEKAIVVAFHAQEGDFRDWDDVDAWSEKIADELRDAR
jgi:menaquinone-dependent protoporphyrinogen oxidase